MQQNFPAGDRDYVIRLEDQVQQLQRQLAEYRPSAEKWTPTVSGEIVAPDQSVRITLSFGGKQVTAKLPASTLNQNNLADLTTSITDTLCEGLVVEKIREVVQPEIDRLMKGTRALPGAGKW